MVCKTYLYFQAVLDILGNLGYHLSLSLPVYLLVPEVQDDLVNLRPQPCQSTPFHLDELKGRFNFNPEKL